MTLLLMPPDTDAAFNRWLGTHFLALDHLGHMWRYLHAQFHFKLQRSEAQSLVDAMLLVTRARFAVLNEAKAAAKARWPEQWEAEG
jgi:hypothetical protein